MTIWLLKQRLSDVDTVVFGEPPSAVPSYWPAQVKSQLVQQGSPATPVELYKWGFSPSPGGFPRPHMEDLFETALGSTLRVLGLVFTLSSVGLSCLFLPAF